MELANDPSIFILNCNDYLTKYSSESRNASKRINARFENIHEGTNRSEKERYVTNNNFSVEEVALSHQEQRDG